MSQPGCGTSFIIRSKGLRKGVFARGASSLLFRRLQGRREPPKKPGTHEENAGEKAGRLLRFAASKGLTFRAFLRVFPAFPSVPFGLAGVGAVGLTPLGQKYLSADRTGPQLRGDAFRCQRKGIFARGASSLLLRRLQGRREPPEKPGTHEEDAGEKTGRLLRFSASKGLTVRAGLRVFPGGEYLITFLPGLPSYFVTSSTSGHVSQRHRKEVSLGDSTRICDFESCHL